MKKIILSLLLATLSGGLPATQIEESQVKIFCTGTKVLLDHLEKEYGETPVIYGQGFSSQNDIMTLWLNPKTLTWSLLMTNGGKTCIVGSGINFTVIDQSKQI